MTNQQEPRESVRSETARRRLRRIDWNAVTAGISAVALVVGAFAALYAAEQVRTAKQLARSEFMREYYVLCQDFNDLQLKLSPGGEWTRPDKGPVTREEWYRVQRYMGLLEQLHVWYLDGIIDLEEIDSTYSHRIVAVYSHPVIRERCLVRESFRWKHLLSLVAELKKMPIFSKLNEAAVSARVTPKQSQLWPPNPPDRADGKAAAHRQPRYAVPGA